MDRGGLFRVSDHSYEFFRVVEYEVRKRLQGLLTSQIETTKTDLLLLLLCFGSRVLSILLERDTAFASSSLAQDPGPMNPAVLGMMHSEDIASQLDYHFVLLWSAVF